MDVLFDHIVAGHRFVAVQTERADGDVHPERVTTLDLDDRQRAVAGSRWMMLDQVHGADVVSVDPSSQVRSSNAWPMSARGDAIVTRDQFHRVAVWAADCAPLALFASDGTVGVAHGGWRGLASGVVAAAVAAVTANGAEIVGAVLGPVIHPCCYEFGERELAAVGAGVGVDPSEITGRTATHQRSLDVPRAVAAALAVNGVALDVIGPCTGCDDRWFSHRIRADRGRHALVAWRDEPNRAEPAQVNVTRRM